MNTVEEIRIKKVHTFLDLAIAAVVFAAGVGVYFLLPGWGILFCLIGIVLFAFYKRANKRVGENTPLEFTTSLEGDHLYLEVYYNTEVPVAYARLYDVAENRFEPTMAMMELRGSRAQILIDKLL